MSSKQRALPHREAFPQTTVAFPPATAWKAWRVTEPRRPVVLIVDEDLGFVWWLGQIFSEAGCQVVPALSSEQTVTLARDLNLEFDLVVVNPELPGISEMIRTLSDSRPPKIVAIRNHHAGVCGALRAHATLERPSGSGPVSQKEWLGYVRSVVKDVQATSVA